MDDQTPNQEPVRGAFITSLNIGGIKCFKAEQVIRFTEPDNPQKLSRWNVIIGENGVGKTTLLRVIRLLIPVVEYYPPTLPFRGRDGYSVWGYGDEFKEILNLEADKIPIGAVSLCFQPNLNRSHAEIPSTNTSLDFSSIKNEWPGFPFLHHHQFPSISVIGYGATRHMAPADLTASSPDFTSPTLFDDTELLVNAEQLYLQLLLRTKESGTEKDKLLFQKIQEILVNVLPEQKHLVAKEKLRTVPTTKGFGTRLEIFTHYGWVPIPELSLGYKTMIAWIVDFASKLFHLFPDSPNPLAEPAICLVDEIDLHMHPKWQRDIMGFLTETFPNTQFIVTAHSPLIVQAAADANIILLKRVDDHVEVIQNPEIVADWRIDQLLTSDLFGLDGPRRQPTNKKVARRKELLQMDNRSQALDLELKALNEELADLPLYDSPFEGKAQAALDKILEVLKSQENG